MIQSTNKSKEKHNNHILIEMKNYLRDIGRNYFLIHVY